MHSLNAQQSRVVKVDNDQQLLNAIENQAVRTFEVQAGYYPSVDRTFNPGTTVYKMVKDDNNRSVSCMYAIVQSVHCFNPVPPDNLHKDTAFAYAFDYAGCGCCPPDDAGTWSVISGPGNVTFTSLTEDTTIFYVDSPGIYTLRYTWPAPWFSRAETQYIYYETYAADLSANDSCGLSTTVHFEYTTPSPDSDATLSWTLNGLPYAGPAFDPAGDTVDFQLTVPTCGQWILEATITAACGPVVSSIPINLFGDQGPEIVGVGPDTAVVCPDEPVFSDPTASGQCSPLVSLTYETDTIPGDCPDHFTLARTWTATDSCGNTSTAFQTIEHLPNPNPPIVEGTYQTQQVIAGDTTYSGCEGVSFPFPEIMTPCGPAEVDYLRSDGGDWDDPFLPGTSTDVCYWGISPCGYSTDTLCFYVTVETCADEFCTLTQGFYGNAGGTFCNGLGTADLIESLLAQGNLVVGYNNNKMTFYPGNSGCIIDLLPGGGPAKKITGANTCASHPGIQMKNGRIFNNLLAQTITLGLNLRLDGELGSLQIFSDTLVTAGSSGCDQPGDTLTSSWIKRTLPLSVYNVLSQNGTIIPTVADLYALANKGLGGGAIGATTLSALVDAVDLINTGFDECRFGYFQEDPTKSAVAPSDGAQITAKSQLAMRIFPNPYNSSTNIEFVSPEDGHVSVEVFSLTGVKVATLFDGWAAAGETYNVKFSGDAGLNQVTSVVVVRTEHETLHRRIMMVR